MAENRGLIHIYCGDGKGKTTAAVGLAVRAAGRDFRVTMVQFLKSTETGELNSLKKIEGIRLIRSEEALGFTFRMNEEQKRHAASVQQQLWEQALVASQSSDLLILDEVMAALSSGMISEEQVLDFLDKKPIELEVVLTGRNPPKAVLERADYVSEMKKIRHPFDSGIPARKGIEK